MRPAAHLARQRRTLHQQLREIRAGSRRRLQLERATQRHACGGPLSARARACLLDCRERRPRELERLGPGPQEPDPQRTLERGYVLAASPQGEAVTTAERAARLQELSLRFSDGILPVRPGER